MFGAGALGAGVASLGWHRPELAWALFTFGAAMGVGALVPGLGRRLYVTWMLLGWAIGRITSPLILGGLYFAVFTPCALWFRLVRRDALQRQLRREQPSYWQPYPEPEDPARYFKQF
jgi:polyferredoxin